jgi:hypothetical protein
MGDPTAKYRKSSNVEPGHIRLIRRQTMFDKKM